MGLAAPAWALLFLFSSQSADKPQILDLEVTLEGNQVHADFHLANVFDEALSERIQTGLPTGFDFQFRLVKPLPLWPFATTRSLASTNFQALAMYNAVTREYLVNYKRNGELIGSRVVLDLEELEEAMTRFEDIQLFSVDDVKTSRRLHVRARAAVGSRSILFLIPTRVKTDWAESERFRLDAEDD